MMRKALLSLGLAAAIGASCSSEDDPNPVTVKNLKYPNTLTITDNGDSTIRLSWIASNFEGDFEGYNVYGAKLTNAEIAALADKGLAKGTPLQLLDNEGNARTEAKEILQNFDYNPDSPFTLTQDEDAESEDSDTEPKISYKPIHNEDEDGDAVLPTCYPEVDTSDSSVFTCTAFTEANEGDNRDGKYAHGTVNFDIDANVAALTYDTQYCFLVFAVQDEGSQISQSSTNFACVRPKYNYSGTLSTTAQEFEIANLAAECVSNGGCADEISSDHYASGSNSSNAGTNPLYLESLSTELFFVTGGQSNCAILELGYRPLGFADPDLPEEAPALGSEYDESLADNTSGYLKRGLSSLIAADYMYIHACADSDDTSTATYQWIYVSGDASGDSTINTSDSNITVQMRLSTTAR